MNILEINGTDYTSQLETNYAVEYIQQTKNVKTNAMGDTTFAIIHPKYKIYATFLPSSEAARAALMAAIDDYVVSVTFRSPVTGSLLTKTCYCSCDKNTYKLLNDGASLLDSVEIRFVEM